MLGLVLLFLLLTYNNALLSNVGKNCLCCYIDRNMLKNGILIDYTDKVKRSFIKEYSVITGDKFASDISKQQLESYYKKHCDTNAHITIYGVVYLFFAFYIILVLVFGCGKMISNEVKKIKKNTKNT
jgi:hypothetical protein